MIPVPTGVRIWIATGHTDMRRGMFGLALQVQQVLKRDPHGGDLYIFRGRRGDLVKVLWHDGVVALTASQLACLLEAIDWRNPRMTWRPSAAG
jgi:transposase